MTSYREFLDFCRSAPPPAEPAVDMMEGMAQDLVDAFEAKRAAEATAKQERLKRRNQAAHKWKWKKKCLRDEEAFKASAETAVNDLDKRTVRKGAQAKVVYFLISLYG